MQIVGQVLQIVARGKKGEFFKNADKMALIGIAMIKGYIAELIILPFTELIEGSIELAYLPE